MKTHRTAYCPTSGLTITSTEYTQPARDGQPARRMFAIRVGSNCVNVTSDKRDAGVLWRQQCKRYGAIDARQFSRF